MPGNYFINITHMTTRDLHITPNNFIALKQILSTLYLTLPATNSFIIRPPHPFIHWSSLDLAGTQSMTNA